MDPPGIRPSPNVYHDKVFAKLSWPINGALRMFTKCLFVCLLFAVVVVFSSLQKRLKGHIKSFNSDTFFSLSIKTA